MIGHIDRRQTDRQTGGEGGGEQREVDVNL